MPCLGNSGGERNGPGTHPVPSLPACRQEEWGGRRARASRVPRTHGTVQEDYYVLRKSHCLGFAEDRIWSVENWIGGQALAELHELDTLWMEIITLEREKP